MKPKVFVDTSAWYALTDADDANHHTASEFLERALTDYQSLVTTNHIIGETYTLLRFRLGHSQAIEFINRLRQSHRTERLYVSQRWEEDAYGLLEKYYDQDFSFIDATSFTTMRSSGIKEVFAFDQHFVAAGFILVPQQKKSRKK
mgnify:CR=1 FL=1